MPLSGSCQRLSTNPRSSRRRSAGYSVPSFRSKNPYDSSFARSARRQSWIEPFFSSAVHSGETSVIRCASYPALAISAFGGLEGRRRGDRHGGASVPATRSSLDAERRKREGGATFRASPSLAGTGQDPWRGRQPPSAPRGSSEE